MQLSFIFSSNQTRTLRGVAITLIAVAVLLIALDQVAGFVIHRVAHEPPFLLRYQNVPGVERLWQFEDEGVAPIIFTGSSEGHMGLSPHAFNDRITAITGQTVQSVNISVWGSVVAIHSALIRNLLIPAKPQIIIYAIEMRAVLPISQHGELVDDFINKPLGYAVTTSSPLERNALLWLMRHSTLFSYRNNLRDWLTGTRAIDDVGYSLSTVDDLGFFREPNIYDRDPTLVKPQFVPFTMDAPTRQYLIDIENSCSQAHVTCILLNLPLHEQAYQFITPADESLYQDTLHGVSLPIWDFNTSICRAALGDASFFNLNHLNASGAEIFSAWVADVYARTQMGRADLGTQTCATLSNNVK